MAHNRQSNILKQTKILPLEEEVIIGSLIGDGSIYSSGKHYRLRVGHTVRHSGYLRWKYDFLRRLCITEPQEVPTTKSVRFGTIGHPELSVIRQNWYDQNGTKTVPSDFSLTPLMLSIWFMDDGCKHRNTVDFSTHCFSIESIKTLQKALEKLNIKTTVVSDSKGYRIYVRQSSYNNFKTLVKPYIQPCMAYKLP